MTIPRFNFAIGEKVDETERFNVMLNELLSWAKQFSDSLSPRETNILRVGLTASHLEESIAAGEWSRARGHAERLEKLIQALQGASSEPSEPSEPEPVPEPPEA
jgi:hypothetical protein